MIDQFNVLVVGLVRNCAKFLKNDISILYNSLSEAKNLHWLLVESDSEDDTIDILKDAKLLNENFDYISFGDLYSKMPFRTERISFCRNAYLDQIKNNEKYNNIDYVVVCDFDGLNTSLTKKSIRSCFIRSDWGVCTANQKGPYYDIWALRHKNWSPNDCFNQYNFLINYNKNAAISFFISVISRMIRIPLDSDWIEVDSAFGGLAVYKKDAMLVSKYKGTTQSGIEICEHVPFHAGIKKYGYKIFINPNLINANIVEHVYKLRIKLILLMIFGIRIFEIFKFLKLKN